MMTEKGTKLEVLEGAGSASDVVAELKNGLVVERSETVDPETNQIEYSITFAADFPGSDPLGEPTKPAIIRVTADKRFYSKFVINEEYDLSFLASAKPVSGKHRN